MNKSKAAPKSSPFDRVPTPKARPQRRGVTFVALSALFLTLGIALAANTTISIPGIEFGRGVTEFPPCIRDTVVDFDLTVSSTQTTIRALEISGLGADCAGQYLRVSLSSDNGTVIRQLTSGQLGSATTLELVVTGTAIEADTVHGINLELSPTAF